ncbi:FtsW/RodA/SpoVE family cell cycle protein [Aquimarina sp. RZ0]|uniref:FtsW/RodA/SpoVE family cell cycle protein n=1 Tax=Aquimarina sp. RZ0 TaxID=2607730 RepID=UPI0011F1C4C7|nr:FtsW/RodA/SpoVE family cell cycle protein [Aquimarina sp. RZ0]KAA1244867.1 cell division protein FtsW [Aquimarina sp. RZ0]
MTKVLNNIRGDKVIWAIAALLALFSFLPVYSASSNLAYLYGDGNTFSFLVKHFAHLILGFGIMYWVHKIPYNYFKGLSIVMIPVVVILLLFTMAQNTTIGGANASRWIRLPLVGVTFQTSTLAALVLMTYVARYLSKIRDKKITFKETILPLWFPVFIILVLILPANFSTTAIIFSMVMILVFLGGYPIKYIATILVTGFFALTFFVLVVKAFPDSFSNRVSTWENRIDNFLNGEDGKEDYQIERAKIAIARGGLIGKGPGKSVQRNFLPQSSSDFIYAIIIEEWGLVGGVFLMLLYLLLLFRLVIVAHKSSDIFGKLLVVGVGLPIVFQALINMAVAVELFPVTGQTLPLVSSGGTSIWMTCMAIGIVLSVSKNRESVIEEEQSEDMETKEENPLDVLSEVI